MGHNNRFSNTLNNSLCFKGLSTSAVLYRTLDSHDNIDNLIQQIADPNTSEDTIRDIYDKIKLDMEHLTYIMNNERSTIIKPWSDCNYNYRALNIATVNTKVQGRLSEIEKGKGELKLNEG